ncbi:phosphoribosylanthranilate isomerase, partial [Singulisphaera rosea]
MAERNVRIKICGLTQITDVLACVSAGVDWIGLNFYPPSVRYVDPSLAVELIAALPDRVDAVGLFVDRSPDEVAAVADRVGLKIVQLHGQEPPEDLLALSHLTVVRAFRLADVSAVQSMHDYLRRCSELGCAPD